MSKSILIIDTPTNCYECPCFMETGWRCQCQLGIDDDVHNGRPDWCPLKPTVNAIPIEWMKKFAYERALNDGEDDYWHFWGVDLLQMIDQWEKENEANAER